MDPLPADMLISCGDILFGDVRAEHPRNRAVMDKTVREKSVELVPKNMSRTTFCFSRGVFSGHSCTAAVRYPQDLYQRILEHGS